MSKNYKELPAFETNEFKVGDRIMVYHHQGWYERIGTEERTVTYIIGDLIIFKDWHYAHFKACRKLEEVKPRRFWISPHDGLSTPFRDHLDDIVDYGAGWILVEEVLND